MTLQWGVLEVPPPPPPPIFSASRDEVGTEEDFGESGAPDFGRIFALRVEMGLRWVEMG